MIFHDCDEYHPCEVCGQSASRHHIVTRGAHGSDDPANLIYLCAEHHTGMGESIHRLGRRGFARRFPQFMDRILLACQMAGKRMA